MRSSQYCPRLKLSFWSCLRDMKERREGEKARKNMKEEAGLFPSLVLFFSSFFLLRAASLVNCLNARNGLFHVCYWSLYSNLNTPINFRAGHPRKNTIQFTALRNFTFLINWTELPFQVIRKGYQGNISSYRLYADQTISCVLINIHLKIFSQGLCFTPFYCYHLLQNSKLFLYRSRTSHISHFRF